MYHDNCLLSVDLDICQFCGNSILLLGELALVSGASGTGSPVQICICRDVCSAVRLKVRCVSLPLASLPWHRPSAHQLVSSLSVVRHFLFCVFKATFCQSVEAHKVTYINKPHH